MAATQYSYSASKSGKTFNAFLYLGSEKVDEKTGLRTSKAVKRWVKAAAEAHKWANSNPDLHAETHYFSGSVTV